MAGLGTEVVTARDSTGVAAIQTGLTDVRLLWLPTDLPLCDILADNITRKIIDNVVTVLVNSVAGARLFLVGVNARVCVVAVVSGKEAICICV